MKAFTVTQGAVLASIAAHLLLLAMLTAQPQPISKKTAHELLPVRLVSPVHEREQPRQAVLKKPAVPLPRPHVDTKVPVQHQPVAAPQQSKPAASPLPQAPLPAPAPTSAPDRPAVTSSALDRHGAPAAQRVAAQPASAAPSQQATAAPRDTVSAKLPAPVPSPRRSEYLALVRSLVERNKEYPSFSRQAGQQGTVLVRVAIGESGTAESVSVVHSSGYQHLDRAALAAVKNAAPFKPPASYGLQSINIEIPITYKLN